MADVGTVKQKLDLYHSGNCSKFCAVMSLQKAYKFLKLILCWPIYTLPSGKSRKSLFRTYSKLLLPLFTNQLC
jgi:hypothetical protein